MNKVETYTTSSGRLFWVNNGSNSIRAPALGLLHLSDPTLSMSGGTSRSCQEPTSTAVQQKSARLLDHLVGSSEQRVRHVSRRNHNSGMPGSAWVSTLVPLADRTCKACRCQAAQAPSCKIRSTDSNPRRGGKYGQSWLSSFRFTVTAPRIRASYSPEVVLLAAVREDDFSRCKAINSTKRALDIQLE